MSEHITTNHLQLFLSVARQRSLSRAAAELDLAPATASERLKALEGEIGAALFVRQGRGVTLTSAGEAFRPFAERALEVLREGRRAALAAGAGRRGQVSIAATVTSGAYLLGPALTTFQRQHPDIDVRVRSAHSWDAPGLLLDGLAELALVSGPSLSLTPHLETLATFTSRLALVAGSRHACAGQVLSREQLAHESWLISFWGPASQRFLEQVRSAAPDAGKWQELSPVELVKAMLLAGMGISLLPEIAARREIATGELVKLQTAADVPRLPIWEIALIRRRGSVLTPAAQALAEALTQHLPRLTD